MLQDHCITIGVAQPSPDLILAAPLCCKTRVSHDLWHLCDSYVRSLEILARRSVVTVGRVERRTGAYGSVLSSAVRQWTGHCRWFGVSLTLELGLRRPGADAKETKETQNTHSTGEARNAGGFPCPNRARELRPLLAVHIFRLRIPRAQHRV